MLKNIYSTKVMLAWKGKCKQRGKNIDAECPQDCRNVIDVLSLIPPELLTNEQANDEEEQELDNDIPEDVSPDNGIVDDVSPDNDSNNTLPDLDNNENDNQNNTDNNTNDSKINILEAIVQKLLTMKNSDKWKHYSRNI